MNYLSSFFRRRENLWIIRIVSISSCWVTMSYIIIFRVKLLLFFFLSLLHLCLFSFDIFFQGICWLCKSFRCLFKILFIFKMTITYKLLFRHFHNFIFIHTPWMQSFRTSDTLEYWHRVSTYTTYITIMKRTSKMKRICVNVLK